MNIKAKAANEAALEQARKVLEALPGLGVSKGKIVIYFEEGKASGVSIDDAVLQLRACKVK